MKPLARIAVLVSGGGTNLQALLDARENGLLPHGQISLVVSSRENAYALNRAQAAGVSTLVLVRKQMSQADFEDQLQKALELHQIDLIVLAGFLCILSEDFTKRWPFRMLNVHPSLIPAFCGNGYYGLKVHEEALRRGVQITGATVHYVNEVPDGGPILLQKAIRVHSGDTPQSLQKRVMEKAEWLLLPKAVEMVAKKIVKEKEKQACT